MMTSRFRAARPRASFAGPAAMIAIALFAAALPATLEAGTVWDGGVVAADHPLASEAGRAALDAGGNAVDAAVAASFYLSVVRPYSCGIGGGGFMVLYLPGESGTPSRAVAIDYRERAPRAVGPDYFEKIDADSQITRYSGRAVGVPGTVAGLLYALEKYGTLDRATVMAPAIRAAREGFAADAHYAQVAAEVTAWYDADSLRRERYPFVWQSLLLEGKVREGSLIRLPEQAEALRMIAEEGSAAFYDGPIGAEIIKAIRGRRGEMALGDLRSYEVTETNPLTGQALGRQFLTMPPPSSGGIALQQILGMLEYHRESLVESGWNSAGYIHLVTEAMKHAFADRAEWLGDAEFVDVPIAHLTDPDYIRARAGQIDPRRTKKPESYGTRAPGPDDHGTSHISVIDGDGNGVACTETINLWFGSRIAVAPYGFVLNDEMDDFLTRRGTRNAYDLEQSDRNLPAPGKHPLSSMSPTIVLKDGAVEVIAGASGGPRIISSTAQTILDVVLFDLGAEEAVAAPRFHHQWMPDELYLEPGLRGREIQASLWGKGHNLKAIDAVGAVQLIRTRQGGYEAACDPRKGGRPAGIAPRDDG